jgi:hypothetical protein
MTPKQRNLLERRVASYRLIYPEHTASDVLNESVEALEALLLENRELKEDLAQINSEKSPCGHWAAHAMTNDYGKTILCLECRVNTLLSEQVDLRAELADAFRLNTPFLRSTYMRELLERIPDRSGEVKP